MIVTDIEICIDLFIGLVGNVLFSSSVVVLDCELVDKPLNADVWLTVVHYVENFLELVHQAVLTRDAF